MKYPILLPNIFNHPFTYESEINLKLGEFVLVPFGKSKITGVVWDEFEKNDNKKFKIKSIIKKLDVTPLKKDTINSGDSFGLILEENNLFYPKIYDIVQKTKEVFDIRKINIGRPYTILSSKDSLKFHSSLPCVPVGL